MYYVSIGFVHKAFVNLYFCVDPIGIVCFKIMVY